MHMSMFLKLYSYNSPIYVDVSAFIGILTGASTDYVNYLNIPDCSLVPNGNKICFLVTSKYLTAEYDNERILYELGNNEVYRNNSKTIVSTQSRTGAYVYICREMISGKPLIVLDTLDSCLLKQGVYLNSDLKPIKSIKSVFLKDYYGRDSVDEDEWKFDRFTRVMTKQRFDSSFESNVMNVKMLISVDNPPPLVEKGMNLSVAEVSTLQNEYELCRRIQRFASHQSRPWCISLFALAGIEKSPLDDMCRYLVALCYFGLNTEPYTKKTFIDFCTKYSLPYNWRSILWNRIKDFWRERFIKYRKRNQTLTLHTHYNLYYKLYDGTINDDNNINRAWMRFNQILSGLLSPDIFCALLNPKTNYEMNNDFPDTIPSAGTGAGVHAYTSFQYDSFEVDYDSIEKKKRTLNEQGITISEFFLNIVFPFEIYDGVRTPERFIKFTVDEHNYLKEFFETTKSAAFRPLPKFPDLNETDMKLLLISPSDTVGNHTMIQIYIKIVKAWCSLVTHMPKNSNQGNDVIDDIKVKCFIANNERRYAYYVDQELTPIHNTEWQVIKSLILFNDNDNVTNFSHWNYLLKKIAKKDDEVAPLWYTPIGIAMSSVFIFTNFKVTRHIYGAQRIVDKYDLYDACLYAIRFVCLCKLHLKNISTDYNFLDSLKRESESVDSVYFYVDNTPKDSRRLNNLYDIPIITNIFGNHIVKNVLLPLLYWSLGKTFVTMFEYLLQVLKGESEGGISRGQRILSALDEKKRQQIMNELNPSLSSYHDEMFYCSRVIIAQMAQVLRRFLECLLIKFETDSIEWPSVLSSCYILDEYNAFMCFQNLSDKDISADEFVVVTLSTYYSSYIYTKNDMALLDKIGNIFCFNALNVLFSLPDDFQKLPRTQIKYDISSWYDFYSGMFIKDAVRNCVFFNAKFSEPIVTITKRINCKTHSSLHPNLRAILYKNMKDNVEPTFSDYEEVDGITLKSRYVLHKLVVSADVGESITGLLLTSYEYHFLSLIQ